MSMSNDRIRFEFTPRHWKTPALRKASQKVLQQAFDISYQESNNLIVKNPCGFTIICRPSQFGRFIVFRNNECGGKEGFTNEIKSLEPVLIEPTCEGFIVEVWRNTHQRCYSTDA